jgi:nucleotide-binding universal stress UspA family protein
MGDIRRILAVSWITQYCQETIHYAVSLAAKYNAELSVIHVVDTLWRHLNSRQNYNKERVKNITD